MKPIYQPSGAAREYCDWALNIYTGCPHRCAYCYCPKVLHCDKEQFFSQVEPRKNIVAEVKKQLEKENITGRLIQLCFIGDPYPTGYDTTPTREIIKLLKEHGNHVQILTKGDGSRDFDLLDENDWYGITYAGYNAVNVIHDIPCVEEPGAESPHIRIKRLAEAHHLGIKTWISFEPVLNDIDVINYLSLDPYYIDKVKIGKLNYHHSAINWAKFGKECEVICRSQRMDYYIKDSLRAEMEKNNV